MRNLSLSFFILALLTGCAGRTPDAPLPTSVDLGPTGGHVGIPIPTEQDKYRSLSMRVNRSPGLSHRPGYEINIRSMTVGSSKSFASVTLLAAPDLSTAESFASTFGPTTSPSLVFELGRQIAAKTVCQEGTITTNTYSRRISNPAEIRQILANSGGRVLGTKVPEGIKGKRLPATEYTRFGWDVNMWCQ